MKTQSIINNATVLAVITNLTLHNGAASAQERYIEVPFDAPSIESQCGATLDFQDVETYDGSYGVSTVFVYTHQSSVGYHVNVGCSGTLISRNLFLSAGHCFYAVGDFVRFNYQRNPSGTIHVGTDFRVIEVVEQVYTQGTDYSIVRLEGSPGDVYGFTPISGRYVDTNDYLTIIGHPNRMPKQVSAGPVSSVTSMLGPYAFQHQADTLGGSSGSGVIDTHGYLVGVHTNAGCSISSDIPGNHAMKMSSLVYISPTLRAMNTDGGPAFCGATSAHTGYVGGWFAAGQLCRDACSSSTAHICTSEEAVLLLQKGETFGLRNPGDRGRIANAFRATSADHIADGDCRGWMSASNSERSACVAISGDHGLPQAWPGGCGTPYPFLCCDVPMNTP